MLRLNSMRRFVFQNFTYLHKKQMASTAYQFRKPQQFYYPDRKQEKQRSQEPAKAPQLVVEAPEKKKLPKDYYYKILDVRRNATTQQIKTAYYALAKRFHPDASNTPQETKHFQEISNAYHILTDESKRQQYDLLGFVKEEESVPIHAVNSTAANKGGDVKIPSSEDLAHLTNNEARLELTFLEAAHGVKKSVDLRLLKKCPTCNGKSPKLANRTTPELCRKCNGTGKISKTTPTYSSVVVCDQCHGKRYTSRFQCVNCENRGIVMETVKVIVPVPPGIKSGEIVSIENPKGSKRIGYRIVVKESDYYNRVGNDVHTDRYISVSEAILGATCKVRGIYEDFELKIEPGTESHTKVVKKGKGIRTGDAVGDHVIVIKIRIPGQLTMKQRQLVLALAKTEDAVYHHST